MDKRSQKLPSFPFKRWDGSLFSPKLRAEKFKTWPYWSIFHLYLFRFLFLNKLTQKHITIQGTCSHTICINDLLIWIYFLLYLLSVILFCFFPIIALPSFSCTLFTLCNEKGASLNQHFSLHTFNVVCIMHHNNFSRFKTEKISKTNKYICT